MSTTPKVVDARVVPWGNDDELCGIEVEFEGGRKIAFPVGDRALAEEQARRAREVPAYAETIWARAICR
jgi:hypothetical protein